jgi:hypothetical protein
MRNRIGTVSLTLVGIMATLCWSAYCRNAAFRTSISRHQNVAPQRRNFSVDGLRAKWPRQHFLTEPRNQVEALHYMF